MASQQGSFSVISTYVEMIPQDGYLQLAIQGDLHVCGDDPIHDKCMYLCNS